MGRWVKTMVSEETYTRIEEYARRHGLSVYAAVRRLIEEGLAGSLDLLRLAEDETVLLLALRCRLLKNPRLRERVLELLEEGDYKVYEGYGFYGDTPLLVRFYMLRNEPRIVRYAALLTYKPRVLKGLIKRLEDLGWKRRFFFEIEARISKYL